MNIGIQDAQNLAHAIVSGRSFSQYSRERKQAAMSLLNVALRYYEKSLAISRAIGYDYNHLKTYKGIMRHLPSSLYRSGVKLGGSLLETDFFSRRARSALMRMNEREGLIPMVFPREETEIRYGDNGLLVPNCEVLVEGGGRRRLREYLHEKQMVSPSEAIGFQLRVGNVAKESCSAS